jgi:hypothetical protein
MSASLYTPREQFCSVAFQGDLREGSRRSFFTPASVAVIGPTEREGSVVSLLNKLQVQGDAHAIDEDDALIEKLLVRDFGVHELLDGGARTNEFDGFGSPFGAGREFVEDGKVEELEFHVRGNPVG